MRQEARVETGAAFKLFQRLDDGNRRLDTVRTALLDLTAQRTADNQSGGRAGSCRKLGVDPAKAASVIGTPFVFTS